MSSSDARCTRSRTNPMISDQRKCDWWQRCVQHVLSFSVLDCSNSNRSKTRTRCVLAALVGLTASTTSNSSSICTTMKLSAFALLTADRLSICRAGRSGRDSSTGEEGGCLGQERPRSWRLVRATPLCRVLVYQCNARVWQVATAGSRTDSRPHWPGSLYRHRHW